MFAEMIIIENYFNDKDKLKIALAVYMSQEIRENSWDYDNNKYTISHENATKLAAKYYILEDFWVPILLHWNHFYWNDIQYWAVQIINSNNNSK